MALLYIFVATPLQQEEIMGHAKAIVKVYAEIIGK